MFPCILIIALTVFMILVGVPWFFRKFPAPTRNIQESGGEAPESFDE